MIRNLVCILIGISAVSACSTKVDQYVLKVKLRSLTEAELYNTDAVNDVLFDAEELNKDSLRSRSREFFLKGIDLVKNQKNPQEGAEMIKSSILLYPDAKSYYELGIALSESGSMESLKESLKAYDLAMSLGYKPVSTLYVRKAAVSNALIQFHPEQKEMYRNDVLYYLKEAFAAGFYDTLSIQNDIRLKGIADAPEYKRIVMNAGAMKQMNAPEGALKFFVESFPGPVSNFEISAENVGNTKDLESLSYEFARYIPEMENASFGRDVSRDFFYVTRLKTNGNYNAVIYSSVSFAGQEMQPVYTTLATFDKKGNTISRKLIACQCSAEKIRTAYYDNGKLVLTDLRRSWKHPVTEVSFENNAVINVVKLSEASYVIDDNGRITNEDVPSDFNDKDVASR